MFNLIILLPLLSGFLLNKSEKLSNKYTALITVVLMLGTLLLSIFLFYIVILKQQSFYIPLFTWLDIELLTVDFGGLYDSLSVIMLCVVTSISLCVHIYSIEYMKNDMHLQRFLCYLSLFTFFMIVLVTSNNFIQLFMGWEGVGLCSYLLINFWFTRIQANKAAIKAVIVNRIGDTSFAIAIFLIFSATGSLDFDINCLVIDTLGYNKTNWICLFLFIGAVGKSAQIGLHTWLPDAMEGPTPVSALIHAATMVTAGVFLIIRCSTLFENTTWILPLMVIVGSLTSFFAATTALVQTDLKRVIAYSTCSQLGYMITACGLSAYNASLFHLSNHAFFKALLFLTAGGIIHALSNEQDIRKMGGLINLLPFSYAMMLIGSLALMGFPFLSGYYSKDCILEIAYAHFTVTGHFAFWLGSLSAFFTSFYSIRLIYLTFLGNTNVNKIIIKSVHDVPVLMALPLIFLSILSIFIGYFTKDIFIGLGTPFWGSSIYISPFFFNKTLVAEFLPFSIKITPVIFSILGSIFSIIIYKNFFYFFNVVKLPRVYYNIYNFLNKKWYVDKIYNEFLVQYFLIIGYTNTYKEVDRGFLELIGPTGVLVTFKSLLKSISNIQKGLVFLHINYIVFNFLLFIFLIIANNFKIPFEILTLICFYFYYGQRK